MSARDEVRLYISDDSVLTHLRFGFAALGTFGCRCRGYIQMRRPVHAAGQRSMIFVSFLCPDETAAGTLRRVARKSWGYGASKIIVREQVEDDEKAW
jgi:hypothetical protein